MTANQQERSSTEYNGKLVCLPVDSFLEILERPSSTLPSVELPGQIDVNRTMRVAKGL